MCLNPRNPIARVYQDRNDQEQVTVQDFSPSIYDMVRTGNVGSMPGNSSSRYTFPDVPDDDDAAHGLPDYQRLKDADMVEREAFVDDFVANPDNYEKSGEVSQEEKIKPAPEAGSSGAE